jgi:hypothetical protein
MEQSRGDTYLYPTDSGSAVDINWANSNAVSTAPPGGL